MKVAKIVYLDNIPMDRWDGQKFIHATGRLLCFEDGTLETEYEDTAEYMVWDESEAVECYEEDFFGSEE